MFYVVLVLWFILASLLYTGYESEIRDLPWWAKLTLMLLILVFAPPIAIISTVTYYIGEEENLNDF